jgi:hypothetical protein
MKVSDIAVRINAQLHPCAGARCKEIRHVHAADTMSDLIAHASPDTLLVTSLNNTQLARVAELMDVPGICLVSGNEPSRALVDSAAGAGTAILVSPLGREETRSLIEACLGAMETAGP